MDAASEGGSELLQLDQYLNCFGCSRHMTVILDMKKYERLIQFAGDSIRPMLKYTKQSFIFFRKQNKALDEDPNGYLKGG